MRTRRIAAAALSALLVAALASSSNAAAAVEVGDPCVASTATQGGPAFPLASPNAGLPLEAPTSGVITRWTVNAGAVPRVPLQALKVFRVGPKAVSSTGETAPATIHAGVNVIAARLPINLGERLGLSGVSPVSGTLLCTAEATEADRIGVPEGPANRSPYDEIAGYRVPVRAAIEPDADRDGFGDETQDRCPQGAAFQSKCPRVRLRRSYVVGPNAVTVRVASSRTASVQLVGITKLGNGALAVGLQPRRVAAGRERAFRFPLPDAVRAARARLGTGRSLILRLEASAVDVRGPVSSDSLRVRLTRRG